MSLRPFLLLAALSLGAAAPPPKVKHVILMLSDGTAPEAWTLARWVKGKALHVDPILSGAVRTYSADSLITDSAPGATAYACGRKAEDKTLAIEPRRVTVPGVPPSPRPGAPLATLLEGAKLHGRAVGLIATSQIQHATPAAFSAHVPHREEYETIALQQVHQGMDVVLGGGLTYLTKRKDQRDLVAQLRTQGVRVVQNGTELEAADKAPVWGAFSDVDMAFELDRPRLKPEQPSIATMTRKALELLAADPKGQKEGLFLFVEGSKVDWASHMNDPVGVATDLLAFDEAVGEALAFAKTRPDTLVVVLSDHANGGLSIGTRDWPRYGKTDFNAVIEPLRRARLTTEGVAGLIKKEKAFEEKEALALLSRELGMDYLFEGERQVIATAAKRLKDKPADESLAGLLGPLFSRRTGLGWTTGGHTGADVTLFSGGPGQVTGLWENTAIGHHLAAAMGFTFDALNQRLFVEASATAQAAGLTCEVDAKAGLLRLGLGGRQAELPLSTNLLRLPGQKEPVRTEGLAVLNPTDGKVYLPAQAIRLAAEGLKGSGKKAA